MKFLTFVDLHEDKNALKEIVKRSSKEDIDFLICAGDITVFGRNLQYFLRQLNDIGKEVYIIPGNHESDEILNEVLADYPNCINFNHKSFQKEDFVFLGYGEGGFMMEDQQFRKISREWYSKYNGKKIVLVTHGPPYGTKIDLLEKRHVGNKDFRRFCNRANVKLMVCGHLHETADLVDNMDNTKVVNPGWDGMVIELN
jgi:uncharacterized protein